MANSIIGVIHLASADGVAFAEKVRKCISEMQDKGLCVEVQYQTTAIKDEVAEIVYSALLIGRAQSVR